MPAAPEAKRAVKVATSSFSTSSFGASADAVTPRPPATAPVTTGRSAMVRTSCAPETSTTGPMISSAESTRCEPTSPRAPEPIGPL